MRKFLLLIFLVPLVAVAQNKHSSSAIRLYNQATKAYKMGEIDKAVDLFYACISDDPSYTEAYLNISKIQFSQKKYGQALETARSAWFYNKSEPVVFSQLGKCFYYTEVYDSSAYYLTIAIDKGANSETDFIHLGRAQIKLELYSEAIANFSKVLEMDKKNSSAYNSRGNAYFQIAEYEKAEADYNKALELNPSSPGIFSNLANVALSKGEFDKAMELINEGIAHAKDGEKVQLLMLKGNYFHQQEDLDNAKAAYQEAYELDNSNAIILTNQASVDIDMENYQSAFDKCNLAIELQPELMEAYFNRGIANEMLRNTESACMDWEEAFILGSEKAEEYLNSPVCNE